MRRLHLLPDGDVFYSGVYNTHYFVPGRFPSSRLNHETGEWSPLGGRHANKNREEGISLILALRFPEYRAQILIAGGGHHNLPRTIQSILHGLGLDSWVSLLRKFVTTSDSVELIDLNDPLPRWKTMSSMRHRRIHANGVLLPDGKVLVIGGMPHHGHGLAATASHPVLPPEIYDPQSDTWTTLEKPQKPRVYHSTALLLPDARVISMGGNPEAKIIEKSIEIFSPPYLFRSERPVILQLPEGIPYGMPFSLRVDNARKISQVVLMRPEVLTHVTNTDQRLLELKFRALSDEKLEIEGPANRAHMPEGYCMLFVINDDGVPCVGKFVKVG